MEFNAKGLELLRSFEKCRLEAYNDGTGRWTIGWGATRKPDGTSVRPGEIWTQAQADMVLSDNIREVSDYLLDLIDPELNDNQFSALVCLAYNIGCEAFEGSSALDAINAGRLAAVPMCIAKWNKARINGVLHVSRGLARRRAAEIALWLTPASETPKET